MIPQHTVVAPHDLRDWSESGNNVNAAAGNGGGTISPETDITGGYNGSLEDSTRPTGSCIRRNRKDSFRIVNIVDTLRLSDSIINEHDELVEEHQVSISGSTPPYATSGLSRPRIGSVDSGMLHAAP